MRAVPWISLLTLLTFGCLEAPIGRTNVEQVHSDAGGLDADAGLTFDAGDVIVDAGEEDTDAGHPDQDAGPDRDAGAEPLDAGDVEADAGEAAPDAGVVEEFDAGEAEFDAGHIVGPDAGQVEPDAGDLEPDAGVALPDAGDVIPDAGQHASDAGHAEEPDAGQVEPDAGDDVPDAGDDDPDAGDDTPDAGDAGPEDECAFDYECESPASCVEGRCVCPTDGCEDVVECQAEDLGTSGCASCLSICEASKDPIEKERDALEQLAAAFRAFRDDTGGWPLEDTDWSVDDPWDAISGGLDPSSFYSWDVALFSQGRYERCSDEVALESCWNGPYLTPGENLASAPWLDQWGRARLYIIIPPEPLASSIPSAPDGAMVIWSKGPDGIDDTGCTQNPTCVWNKSATARGEPSVAGADDVILFVGTTVSNEP